MRRTAVRLSPFALALVAAAMLSPAAGASTISSESGVLVYRAAPGEGNSVTLDPAGAGKVLIADNGFSVPITLGTGDCTPGVFDAEATCTVGAAGMRLELGDQQDSLNVHDGLGSFPISADLGDALDTYVAPASGTTPPVVQGGGGDDNLLGGPLADALRGGPGNDTINGRGGPDQVFGEDGDDHMNGDQQDAPAADVIDGGAGFDDISDEWGDGAASPAAVDVSLDGAADDGRAGEGDNVVGIEKIWVASPGTVAGSAGADDIYLFAAAGTSTILGLAGDDIVKGGDAAETVDGGAGADKVVGGRGDDVLIGGPGQDTIFGDNDAGGCGPIICAIQSGSDTIRARDGERDSIDCGVGDDSAEVDAVDVVANCERVDRSAGAGGGAGSGPDAAALTLPRKASLRALAGGRLRIGVSCPGKCSAKLKLVAGKALARKLKLGRSRAAATGSGKLSRAGKVNVRLAVPARARARLRSLRSARLTVELTLVQDGRRTVSTKPLLLKR